MRAILILGFACAAAVRAASFMGVMVQEIDADRARELKLKEDFGVEVTRVEPESPAERAGLKLGDAVQSYNGQRVEGMEQFKRLVNETPAGREVRLDLMRGGMPMTIVVKMGVKKVNILPAPTPMMPMPPAPNVPTIRPDLPRTFWGWRSSMLGIEAEALEGQLAQYFGVKEGVLVRSVNKGSPAEKAGMKAGDVITRVDEVKVTQPADISNEIRSARGRAVSVVLMRDHKEMTLNVTPDEDDHSQWWWFSPQVQPLAPERLNAPWMQ